ncbi:glucuronosyltransferase [Erythrobacter sp. SCSIO 43205]|uniref:glycosyltransferase n=1 Tax=Erythrobacter sp. SCSIO 43205 TaxID=2779361 RepID=UPI001CA9B181|nr:glycosyltransferase [Erythrobacter sp. SCSIO 43205]UAB78229.1 glucuronosyltransferase [Erythrobacter sp. SCSIO 43205]
MILVTVGMQLGFDRLIEAMDRLAPSLGQEVIAQVGRGEYTPQNMEARISIAPAEFEQLVARCQLIVAHAGIGTVLTAQRFDKPIVLVPRQFEYSEHRNDHQIATARHLEGRPGVLIAMEEGELEAKIAQGLAINVADAPVSATAAQLHQAIGSFIETGKL